MTNYPIGDFLIRIKNAAHAEKHEVTAPSSKLIRAVASSLKKIGILSEVKNEKHDIVVSLAHHKKEPMLIDLKLVSTPGLRVYSSLKDLKARRRKGVTRLVVSTPSGVMSDLEAIKKGLGGEVIVEIW